MLSPTPLRASPAPGLNQDSPGAQAASQEFDLAGSSPAISRLRLQIHRIGPHFRTVLLRGEPGTEIESVARRLHSLSPGSAGQFVACHAGTLDDALPNSSAPSVLDSLDWLTGMARGGTLLLGGIDEMPHEAQSRLLRTLRRNEFAEAAPTQASPRPGLRIIAASSEDLRILASAGRFSHELYQRLATVEIVIPPLRERTEDLPTLAQALLDRLAALHGCVPCTVSPEALARILSYPWPGNRHELENLLRSAMLQREGSTLELHHLPSLVAHTASGTSRSAPESVRLQDVVERHVLRVLKDCSGNKLRAADRLGISRSTLYRMLDTAAAVHGPR